MTAVQNPGQPTRTQLDGLARLRALHRERAKYDPAAFCSYVLRDELTNKPISLQPMHEEWHALISNNPRTLIWSHVEAGKTQNVSVGRVLFELGRNPNLRVIIYSATDEYAQKICLTIAKYIEQSKELHEVFPNLKRGSGPWNAHKLSIAKPDGAIAKDASVEVYGVQSEVLGARCDLLVIDDVLSYKNTLSAAHRDELWSRIQSTLQGRLTVGARVICIGTAWHPEDIMHRFASKKNWIAVRYPVMDETGRLSWPERWPKSRIDEKRRDMIPIEINRQLFCIARSDEESVFKREWIDECLHRGNGRGAGKPGMLATKGIKSVPAGYATYSGVDLSSGEGKSALSCIFTILVHPNEDREILNIESGRWHGPEIADRIISTHRRFMSIIMIEGNAVQRWMNQFVKKFAAIPMRTYMTSGKTFVDPVLGIESMAAEMANGKWIIPNHNGAMHPEVAHWLNEVLYYDPHSHAGDRLMASFFARENARQRALKGRTGRLSFA